MTDDGARLPEGWYTDPTKPAQFRWWNGETWTGHTSRTHDAAHPAAGGEPSPRPHRRRNILIAVGSAAATLITAATLVIPFVFDLTQRESGADTVEVTDREAAAAEPAPTAVAEAAPASLATFDELAFSGDQDGIPGWRGGTIAIDAPFADMPLDTGEMGCSDAQSAWLKTHAVRNDTRAVVNGQPHILVSGEIRNTATTGGAVSLRNLRVEGEFETPTPRFTIECQKGGEGAGAPPIWTTAVLGDPSPAVYMENPDAAQYGWEGTPPDLVGTPFTENLDPGEYSQLFLLLSGIDDTRDFTGRVVTDVVSGTETFEAVLKEGTLQVAPPQITTVHAYIGHGGLFCFPDASWVNEANFGYPTPDLSPYACTPQELVAMAKTAVPTSSGQG
jgi:hypothetical protein